MGVYRGPLHVEEEDVAEVEAVGKVELTGVTDAAMVVAVVEEDDVPGVEVADEVEFAGVIDAAMVVVMVLVGRVVVVVEVDVGMVIIMVDVGRVVVVVELAIVDELDETIEVLLEMDKELEIEVIDALEFVRVLVVVNVDSGIAVVKADEESGLEEEIAVVELGDRVVFEEWLEELAIEEVDDEFAEVDVANTVVIVEVEGMMVLV